jgi:hypothetical protein
MKHRQAYLLCVAFAATSCSELGTDEDEGGSTTHGVSVTWTNVVRATASGDDLTKTDPGGKWNAGAVSVETLAGDGYLQFTTAEATTTKMAGLGNGDSNQGFSDIEFAIRLKASGGVAVYESGALRGSFGTYAAGDLFRVIVEDGVVSYQKNGVTFYTSSVAPSFPLLCDTSLLTDGATIRDVALTPTSLTWQNVVGLDIAGTTLTKTGASGWSAGAASVEALADDGFVEFTTNESTTQKMAGLSNGDVDQSQADIDYAIYLKANGVFGVYEGGVLRGQNFGTYTAGDTFRVEVSGGVVRYSKNGAAPFYTSATAPTFPLLVDTSFNTPGGTIRDAALTDASDACPVYDGGGTICGGSFTVANDFDLAAIADCSNITGNLTITAPGLTTIALPNLERVGGNLVVMGNTTLAKLLLAQLKEVGGTLRLELGSVTTEVDLSRLHSGGSLVSGAAPGGLQVPCLETVGGNLSLTPPLTAPALSTIGGNVDARTLVAPNLTLVGGVLSFVDGMDFPLLAQTGGLLIAYSPYLPWSAPDVDLPSLHTVTGMLAAAVYWTGFDNYDISCGSDARAYTLSVPALEQVGSLVFCNLPDTFDMPQLRFVNGPTLKDNSFDNPGIHIATPGDPDTAIDLPALEDVRGNVKITAPVQLPSLVRIRGSLLVLSSITAPALQEITAKLWFYRDGLSADNLTTVGGALGIAYPATTVSLPSLTAVDSLNATGTSSGGYLSTLNLPALTTVTGSSASSDGGLIRIKRTLLTTLSMPALIATPGNLEIRSNSLLTSLDFPALTSVGPSLTITNNDALPNCYATSLLAQLQAAGWTGTWTINRNGTGTCE